MLFNLRKCAFFAITHILCLSNSFAVPFGDLSENNVVFLISNVGNLTGATNFGYGYIGNSEIESEERMGFECGWKKINDVGSAKGRLQQSVYEKLALSGLAMGLNEIPVPSCVEALSTDFLPSGGPGTLMGPTELHRSVETHGIVAAKYQSLRRQLGLHFYIRALIWEDYIKHRSQEICSNTSQYFKERCVEEQSLLERIRTSQPFLDKDYRSQSMVILDLVKKIVGFDKYQEGLKWSGKDSLNIEGLIRSVGKEFKATGSSELVHEIQELHGDLINGYRTKVMAQVAGLCELNVNSMVDNYPSAVRQLLFESQDDLSDVRQLLCFSRKFREQQKLLIKKKEVRCQDYKVNRNDVGGIVSKPGLEFKTEDLKNIYISVRVPVLIGTDVTVPELESAFDIWKVWAEDFYNCRSGTLEGRDLSCGDGSYFSRTGKSIRFSFDFYLTEESIPGSITVHRCYDNDEPDRSRRSDCAFLRQKRIDQCLANGTEPEMCESEYSEHDDRMFSRENASNYTLKAPEKTIVHELGHYLGLPDEYNTGGFWLFKLLGGYPSIMATVSGPIEKLTFLDSHFDEMIAPISCLEK